MQSDAAHSRYRAERLGVVSALADSDVEQQRKQAAKMVDCCSCPHVGLTAGGAVAAVWFRCRVRFCPLCSHARSRQVSDRVMHATRDADSLRFLTLTRAHTNEPLKVQLDALYQSYRDLRRTVEWKRHVVGGIATLEVERNEETGEWHPHLHVLIDGCYWEHARIKATWKAVTGDSDIVWIKAVPSRRKIANYVAKYASKPADIAGWPPDVIREYAAALHRRRLVIATGNMHGSKLDAIEEQERDTIEGDRIPLHALERRSQLGCKRAAVVLSALVQQSAAYAGSMTRRPAGTLPNIAPPSGAVMAAAPGAYRDLLALWQDDPVVFVIGGSGSWDVPPLPKRPPGTGRPRDRTEPISDWHKPSTRHV